MTANPQCPLDLFAMLHLEKKMNLARVLEIENHVSSSSCRHPPLKDMVLHGALDGSTPLLVACEQGDLDSVQHIVDVWGVDVGEAANFYNPKGENIRGATPLFVAALKRHVDIVRFLISKGAPVNAITSTEGNSRGDGGITPLQVAVDYKRTELAISWKDFCLEKNVIIVEHLLQAGANPSTLSPDGQPMWCFGGVHTIIALINHSIDVNLRDSTGETILHSWISWASIGSLIIGDREKFFLDGVQLLLTGVDLMARERRGFTPILLAAMELSDLDSDSGSTLPTLLGILEALLEREEIDAAEKVDAMELAGAHLLLALEHEKAFQYWRRALLLRDSLSHHPKIPLQMTSAGRTEWITREQLENVIRDPSVWYTQSKVAVLRINADRSFEAVLHSYIGGYSREVEEALTQTQKSDLLLESLGVSLRFDPNENDFWEHTIYLIKKLITNLSSTLVNDMPLPNVECERIKTFLKLVENLILAADPNTELPGLRLNYEFFAFLVSVPDVILREEVWKFLSNSASRRDIYEGTKLAQACKKKDWKTLRFLLHLRANPNETTGSGGNGPLHLVADQQVSLEMEDTLGNLLFLYGAQPHQKNNEAKTAVDIWIERNCGVEAMESPKWKNRPDWCRNTVPKLGCLAAKTIHTHRIPYTRPGDLPVNLIRFLENN